MNKTKWEKSKRLVEARDGEKCLKCLGPATAVHHRKVRGSGGSGDPEVNYGLANLVSVCEECHREIHLHPANSYENGFLVHSWEDPAKIPLTVKPGTFWVNLTPDGEINVINQMVLF